MMNLRIRVLAMSAMMVLGMAAQAQACFWPFCCHGGYGGGYAWGGPVGYGRPVAFRRGFYAGYYAASTSCCSPCSSCGYGPVGCSNCGVTSYYGSSCCSSCGVSYYGSSCCGCSSCGTAGCSNCSVDYYPDSSDSTSTYSDSGSVQSTDPTDADPLDDDFGPNNRSTDEDAEAEDSIPDDFETPFSPAPGDPTNGEDPPMAAPLQVGPQLTWQVMPTRTRVHVESEIRAPRVARVEAAPVVPDLSILRVASFDE